MCHGGHHDARNADEKNARKQRITTCKDFAGARMHYIDRSHAAQDHRGIENGVYPRHRFEPIIPPGSQYPRNANDQQRHADVACHALHKCLLRNHMGTPVFVQSARPC